ncbi:MAG: hypothetical protein ABI224_15240 [Acetobacteraceae bacterium]
MRGFDSLVLVSVAAAAVIQVTSLAIQVPASEVVVPAAEQTACCRYQASSTGEPSWSIPFTLRFHPTDGENLQSLGLGPDRELDGNGMWDLGPTTPPRLASDQPPPWNFAWAFLTIHDDLDEQDSAAFQDSPSSMLDGSGGQPNASVPAKGGAPRVEPLHQVNFAAGLAPPPPEVVQSPLIESFVSSPNLSPSLDPPAGPGSDPPGSPIPGGSPNGDGSSGVPEPASIGLLAMALAGLAAARGMRLPSRQRGYCRG